LPHPNQVDVIGLFPKEELTADGCTEMPVYAILLPAVAQYYITYLIQYSNYEKKPATIY